MAAAALVADDDELVESLEPFDFASDFSLLPDEPAPSDEPLDDSLDAPALSPPDEPFDPPDTEAARLSVL